ncbi:hypothetical protein [Devosia sp.]|uniref:hypothetical protein n=1 Tax=Devosia sp. TaxID=1871048 RepID=UPI002EEA5BE3
MNKMLTTTSIALLLGLAAPVALTATAGAQEVMVDVTFSDAVTTAYPSADAAALCGIAEEEIVDGACDSALASSEADGFLDELDSGGNENSAREFAPGQLKGEGESAREYAPGQTKEEGESARSEAPGQQKKD